MPAMKQSRIGRPPDADVPRSVRCLVRLTPEEYAGCRAAALADSRTVSDWLRVQALRAM